jgi:hypothetical protein
MLGISALFGLVLAWFGFYKESNMQEKKQYEKPAISNWGTVADLTKTGRTQPGDDGKGGSAASQGG